MAWSFSLLFFDFNLFGSFRGSCGVSYHCSGRTRSRAALLCRLCRQKTSILQQRLLMVKSPQHDGLQQGGWTTPLYGSGTFVGLYHSTDCIEGGIESDCFSLSGLHVGVIHWVFKGCLSVGALMAHIAIELDLGACPEKQNEKQ